MRRGPLILLAGACAVLAACGARPTRPPCPAGKTCLEYGVSAEPASLDPQKASTTTETAIIGDFMVGLIEDGPDGKPLPGLAERWSSSADRLTWTFHLRPAVWSDGVRVTANDFVFAWRRMLDPKTASPNAFILQVLANGEAVNAGRAPPQALGVRAIEARTLEVRLAHPAPQLLQLLKHASFYPLPEHAVARWGDGWAQPGRYVADGPFIPVSWKLGDRLQATKNPRFFDAAKVCLDRVAYYPTTDAVAAERRVKRGELDVSNSIQSNRVAYLRGRGGMGAYVRVHPYLGVAYIAFNSRDVPALKDRRVRRALSMAIDREFITGKLLRAGQTPAYAFTPPGMADYRNPLPPVWASWPLARRQAAARGLLAQAGFGPAHPLRIELKLPNTSDPSLYAPAIQADWKAVGVEASLALNEPQIAFAAYRIRDFQAGIASWIADDDDPMSFLGLMQSKTGQRNYAGYDNPAYDALLAQADREADAVRRGGDLARAEAIMLDDAAVAPLYVTVSRNLVDPRVTGWVDNMADIHRARYLCLPPRVHQP